MKLSLWQRYVGQSLKSATFLAFLMATTAEDTAQYILLFVIFFMAEFTLSFILGKDSMENDMKLQRRKIRKIADKYNTAA